MEELLAVMLADQPAMAEKHSIRMNERYRMREGINRQEGLMELLGRLPPDISSSLEISTAP